MKKRLFLVAVCSVMLSIGLVNAQPDRGRSIGHTRSEIRHSPARADKPLAKVNHKPTPVPPPPPAHRHHVHHHMHHHAVPVPPPPPAPKRVAYVASPATTAATVAGVAVVAGLLGAAISSR